MAKQVSKTRLKLALVGGETLLGKDIEEVIKQRTPGTNLASFAASGEGNFGEEDGEPIFLEPLEARTLQDVRAVLVAGTPEGARKAYELAKAAGGRPIVIDCSGFLESYPEARVVAPLASEFHAGQSWLLSVAHPAASALALILKKLARYGQLQRVVAHVFEPASERGKRGISELHRQTTNLLGFKPLDKDVFDAQLSFNLLAQFGEEASAQLTAVEDRIERHLASILSSDPGTGTAPLPSLRVVGAPVFHGYSVSMWVEFETIPTAQGLREALASAQIEVRGQKEEPPNNVGVVSQSELVAGDIRLDRNNSRAVWFWIAFDNLRLTADAAVDVAGKLAAEPS
ncbi:MAG: hypothetical protein M3Y72_03645 [Acidobacteriota bacterium]|nr:hypothetical protein [Acidobacteriota bacterium]